MAIIDGRARDADPAYARVRVIIKLAEGGPRSATAEAPYPGALHELARAEPEMEFRAYLADEDLRVAGTAPFDRYVTAEVADREAGAALARRLNALDLIEEAYVEGGPVPPPVNPDDDPRSGDQGYLGAAPVGIDARWAWSLTDGAGIGFVDLERGWTLDHEDLAAAGISLISGQSRDFHGHGTAVLGQMVAVDNARGGIGIAPGASARVVSQWRNASTYDTAAAILSAGQAMSAGDVLLLEAQTDFAALEDVPVEVETAVFDAIRHVVDAGIVVVEAAGNGRHDLDTFVNGSGRRVLDRRSPDFRDSGAIMVGAASSAAPHGRLAFSNHGSRIDCYGWGQNIDTAGDGWEGTSKTEYTADFGGTSGASPMVAGAAVLLQSWRLGHSGQTYNPAAVRRLLSAALPNTASANPSGDRIGVMPNLHAIIQGEILRERSRGLRENHVPMIYILIGLIDDGPGIYWVPGRGPIPVNPDWLPIAQSIAAPKRDLLAAMAVREMTELIADEAARTDLARAATKAMRGAVERIARMP